MGAGNVDSIGNTLLKNSYPHYPQTCLGKITKQVFSFLVNIIVT